MHESLLQKFILQLYKKSPCTFEGGEKVQGAEKYFMLFVFL